MFNNIGINSLLLIEPMLYFKYKKFIKIFKIVKKANNTEKMQWRLEEKYGDVANEAISLLKAKGIVGCIGLYNEYVDCSKIDAIILEYEAKRSSMFWGFLKWVIGTLLTIAGLVIAYLSLNKII